MSRPAIVVQGLGKRYRIGQRMSYKTMREALSQLCSVGGVWRRDARLAAASEIWALQDVSFEVKPGEVLGVIGANGAGKTTLLKLLSRITEPTTGHAHVRGRLGSLLEVGTGFHPELTGRENIYLNGAILGMRRTEIQRTFDAIVEFSGVERFIETPVKHYSSGMYMRLAFAVAAHLQTEILLVDEVLAVGDSAFQLKCLNKMSEVAGGGKTIVFVSHNLESVTKLCGRGLLLEDGNAIHMGTPHDCVDRYLVALRDRGRSDTGSISLREHAGRRKHHNGPVRLTSFSMRDHDGRVTWSVSCGRPVTLILGYELVEGSNAHEVSFVIAVSNLYNHNLSCWRSHDTAPEPLSVTQDGEVACRIPRLPLVPGFYRLSVSCNTEAGFSDSVYDAAVMEVTGNGFYLSGYLPDRAHGEVLVDHQWDLLESSRSMPTAQAGPAA